MKAMRTKMQEPKKIDPEVFHPNTSDKGLMRRQNINEESTIASIMKQEERVRSTTYIGMITSKLNAPSEIM